MDDKQTVGSASLDLMLKNHAQASAIDYEREMHKEYEREIFHCIDAHLTKIDGSFFVVVLRKQERLMSNVYRNFFLARKSCPTPTYDQVVYKYHRDLDAVEFLWVVPDMETCAVFTRNALQIDAQEKQLLKFVLDFNDGTLDRLAKTFNNEE